MYELPSEFVRPSPTPASGQQVLADRQQPTRGFTIRQPFPPTLQVSQHAIQRLRRVDIRRGTTCRVYVRLQIAPSQFGSTRSTSGVGLCIRDLVPDAVSE